MFTGNHIKKVITLLFVIANIEILFFNFLKYFLSGPFLKKNLDSNCYNVASVLCFGFLAVRHVVILASRPGSKTAAPALQPPDH